MPEDDSDDMTLRETSRALPIALLRARDTVMAPIREMLYNIGMTEQKWRILRTLEEEGWLEHTAIAERACLLLPSVTRIIRSMEEAGLIHRLEDKKDRRRMLVGISEKGRTIIRENIHLSNQVYRQLELKLGKKKVEDLLDLLEELQNTKL